MLDELAALFSTNQVQSVGQVLTTVSQFIGFLEQRLEGDAQKVNTAIEYIKTIFDSHKKV
jgi:hypothetical protein